MTAARYLWVGAAATAAALGALAIAAFTDPSGGRAAPAPLALPTISPARAAPAGIPIGLDFGDTLFAADTAAVDAGLADAKAIGAGWIRLDLPWDGIQPSWSSTTYDWSNFDRIVAAAHADGLRMLVTVVDPPVWARDAACRSQEACEPASAAAYAEFAASAAQRYAPLGVHDWEIWNEENLAGFATSSNPEAAYTLVLTDSYRAIHAADPHALVMLGGLGMVDDDPARQWIGAYEFLSGVAAAGGLDYADAIGVHPYDWTSLPTEAPPFTLIDSASQSLESVLVAHGRPQIPFWITETGAPTSGPGPAATGPSGDAGHASLQWQSQLATDIVADETVDPRIGGLFWYTDTDLPKSGLYFGLRTATGTKKPVFAALTKAIATYHENLQR